MFKSKNKKKNKFLSLLEKSSKKNRLLNVITRNVPKTDRRGNLKIRKVSSFKRRKIKFLKKYMLFFKSNRFKLKKKPKSKKRVHKKVLTPVLEYKKTFLPFIFNHKILFLFLNNFYSSAEKKWESISILANHIFSQTDDLQCLITDYILSSKLNINWVNNFLFCFLKLYLKIFKYDPKQHAFWRWVGPRAQSPVFFGKKKLNLWIRNFSKRCFKLNYFFFLTRFFFNPKKAKLVKYKLKDNNLSYYRVENNSVRKFKNTKRGFLYVTFARRNTFFNLADHMHKTKQLTTVRREGFLGRRRSDYTSIFSTARIVKQKFKYLNFSSISVIYKGWSRFRLAVKKSLRYRDRFKIPIAYIRYVVKIPHNGCRPRKVKRKKRKRKLFLKRRFKRKFFFVKFKKVKVYDKRKFKKRKFKKRKFKKNKNVHY